MCCLCQHTPRVHLRSSFARRNNVTPKYKSYIIFYFSVAEQNSGAARAIFRTFSEFFFVSIKISHDRCLLAKANSCRQVPRHHLSVYFFLGAAWPIVSAVRPATRTQTAKKIYLLGGALLSSLGLGGLLGSLGLGDLGGGSLCRARGSGLCGRGSLGGGLCGGGSLCGRGSLGGSFCGGAFGGRPEMLVNMRLRSNFHDTYFLTALAILDLRTGRCGAHRALK
jgi:hypothetical protein